MKGLGRYWGYAAFILLIIAWDQSAAPIVIIALSLISTFYFLFRAPATCGAPNRQEGEWCRNNALGILPGCRIRAHKWAKVKTAFFSRRWREANRGLWVDSKERLASASAIVSIVSGLVGTVVALVG